MFEVGEFVDDDVVFDPGGEVFDLVADADGFVDVGAAAEALALVADEPDGEGEGAVEVYSVEVVGAF